MTEKVETLHASGFLISEAFGNRSRDNGVLASGQNLGAGTVLGKTATAGTATGAAGAGNTGNGTITAVTIGGAAKVGVYRAIMIEPAANLGTFEVNDPDGVLVGRGVVGTPFAGPVNFTLNDGATDFVSGDFFDITVSGLTTKYKILAPAATDGTQNAAGILGSPVDATAADLACLVITRAAEVNGNELTWPGGITAPQKDIATAQLAATGVIVR